MAKSASEEEALVAVDTFTSLIRVEQNVPVSVSISGTFDGTVTLQRRLDGTNWRDHTSWTDEVETTYQSDETQDVRLGFTIFASGTATCRIGKG
jgi:hypothetical protein